MKSDLKKINQNKEYNSFFAKILSSTEDLSSKRLAFLLSLACLTILTFFLEVKLLKAGEYSLVYDVYLAYAIISLILGGFVTADILERILNKRKK